MARLLCRTPLPEIRSRAGQADRPPHNLPTREDVRNGMKLNDPASYESESFGVFECKAH